MADCRCRWRRRGADGGLKLPEGRAVATVEGATLGDLDGCPNSAFLYFSLPVAAPACQALDTQVNALPTLPVLARGVSAAGTPCLSDFSRQVAAQGFQAVDSQLNALQRL